MSAETKAEVNVRQAVPFFRVADIEASLRFYMDGLGFSRKHQWIDEGRLRWCWLELGEAALMLQEYEKESGAWKPEEKVGVGIDIYFICHDSLAIYHEAITRGLHPERPFVGNGMWVVVLKDPDGYRICFESPANAPEETEYAG